MDCAHIDSLNIKNYMWHSSPYLWLTTRFLCSFPLRSIMVATSNSQVGAQAYQGCRDHEHITLIYIGKPSSIWLKLARHWKQVTQRHFNSTQPDTWAEGGKNAYKQNIFDIWTLEFHLTNHTYRDHPWFFSETLLQPCLALGPLSCSQCVWPFIYSNNSPPQHVTHCINVFLPSPDP